MWLQAVPIHFWTSGRSSNCDRRQGFEGKAGGRLLKDVRCCMIANHSTQSNQHPIMSEHGINCKQRRSPCFVHRAEQSDYSFHCVKSSAVLSGSDQNTALKRLPLLACALESLGKHSIWLEHPLSLSKMPQAASVNCLESNPKLAPTSSLSSCDPPARQVAGRLPPGLSALCAIAAVGTCAHQPWQDPSGYLT